jgi:O-antigen/teichoic acid export membrane protein
LDHGLWSGSRAVATTQSPVLIHAQKPFVETTDTDTTRPKRNSVAAKVLEIICGTHALALVDQAVVSCSSFLTTVLVARSTYPNELGSYSMATSLLLPLFCVQESLISLPYTIQRHHSMGTPMQCAGSSLAHNTQLSLLAMAVLALVALGLSAGNAPPELVTAIWVLAGVAPFALLREFARRFAFAHLHMAQALVLDLGAAAIQLVAIWCLGLIGWMSAATACAALGVSCAVVGIGWLYIACPKFSIWGFHVRQTMKQSWALGKWIGAGQLAMYVRAYVAHWLLAFVEGTAATGIYAACTSVVAFANPFILGFSNVLAPKNALVLSERGGAALLRETIRDTLLISIAMSLFCGVIALIGEDVMHLLYQNKAYEGHGFTVTVLAFATTANAVYLHPMHWPALSVLVQFSGPHYSPSD